ncbi:hypothetical protein ZIOFF_039862 [Zingiber officinale]|uniref:Uncharacterized protein n=1 Tax=Zingiber officinale TaxID=94328 RepID=A0A8J5KUM9_ZINOF|nr:hypothetical protein ZIOFF_039862 [Zingiber officinale]
MSFSVLLSSTSHCALASLSLSPLAQVAAPIINTVLPPAAPTSMSLFFSEVVEMAFAGGMVAALEAAGVGGKRRFKSLYYGLRTKIERQLATGYNARRRRRESKRRRSSFHYDPFSYALNFDDTSASLSL